MALILRIPLAISPWIVVVIPLVSLTLCGLGALIGLVGRTPQEVDSISTLTTFLLLAVGPVIIPADALPGIVQVIGLFSPATYAASALRQVVLNMPDRIPLAVDILALTVLLIGFLWLVGQRIDWRER